MNLNLNLIAHILASEMMMLCLGSTLDMDKMDVGAIYGHTDQTQPEALQKCFLFVLKQLWTCLNITEICVLHLYDFKHFVPVHLECNTQERQR